MQNKGVYTIMSTISLSTRLAREEARKIDELAGELGLDRGSLLKQLIRKGYKDIQTERALDAYRHGTITLSRAAEISGLSLRDIFLRLPEESIELNYDLRELKRDMEEV
jgi:predicted HTH domain antitoxin